MSKDERKEMIENIAERFTQMDDVDKSYIAGYMAGKQEERQKWDSRERQRLQQHESGIDRRGWSQFPEHPTHEIVGMA